MKQFLTFLALALITVTGRAQNGYQVTLQVPKQIKGIIYLVYYDGPRLNIQDSGMMNAKGTLVFKRKEKLSPGIYLFYFPGRQQLEFLVGKEQIIHVRTDTSDVLNKTVITGSKEDKLFRQYQKFVSVKGKQLNEARALYNAAVTRADSAKHEAGFQRLNKELSDYRKNIVKQQPASMLAALFNAMQEAQVPNPNPVSRQDSIDNFNYYKAHYWDGITFMDDRIIRTPFFMPKLERYYRDVLAPLGPKEIIKDVDYRLLLARNSPDMFKLLLNWLTDEYINPKYMGQDAVFVHLCEKYHLPGQTSWLNEKQIKVIFDRYYMLAYNVVGEKAVDLNMLDKDDRPVTLYEQTGEYTIVVFWDPNCGHCKEEVPRLDSAYKASWKAQGVKMFGVLAEDTKPEWIKFINERNLNEWTHVYQTKEMAKAEQDAQRPPYKQSYDVITTPTIFLLDKEKRIVAKKLNWQQLDDMLRSFREQKK